MIDSNTPVYGILGNPISHSLSPIMQNCAFSHTKVSGVYVAFKVTDLDSAIKGIKALNIKGVSVTIPFKEAVIESLDQIEDTARKIGAVNTIVNKDGILSGYNTDCTAAIAALSEKTDISEKNIAVIGAGGAARSICFGVILKGANLTIFNRSKNKGQKLADHLGANFRDMSEFNKQEYQILINTTPVGMWPDIESIPIQPEYIHKDMLVMDIIYNPVKTRLLQVAENKGCKIIDGVFMFVRQGALQFEIWTNQKAPVNVMYESVMNFLQKRKNGNFK